MDKTSDIPQSVLDAINDDAEKLYPYHGNEAFGFQQTRRKAYTTGRQEQLQKDLEFMEWLVGFFDCDDFIDEPIWTGLSQGKEIKGTTIELYQEYLNSKK